MTTELTKAAQQALEAYDAFADADDFSTLFELTRKMNVLRDLTQRPAAQTEREAFEAWARPNGYDLRRNDVLGHYSSIDTSRAWDGFRAGRASLPAPQQATPATPEDMKVYDGIAAGYFADTQQATPKRHLTVTTNQQGEAVMVSWQDDEHRILDVVWERKPATPEPVVEPTEWQARANGSKYDDAWRKVTPTAGEPTVRQRVEYLRSLKRADGQPAYEFRALYTRPAPGVPDAEDLRDRLVAISSAVADSDDRAAQSMLSETLRLLAAAQAKGADQ